MLQRQNHHLTPSVRRVSYLPSSLSPTNQTNQPSPKPSCMRRTLLPGEQVPRIFLICLADVGQLIRCLAGRRAGGTPGTGPPAIGWPAALPPRAAWHRDSAWTGHHPLQFQSAVGSSAAGRPKLPVDITQLVYLCRAVAQALAVSVAVYAASEAASRSAERCPSTAETGSAHGPWRRHDAASCAVGVGATPRPGVARDTSSAARARRLRVVTAGIAVG